MDINCVYDCDYQKEGKCTLTELPDAFDSPGGGAKRDEDVDCLYYKRKPGN